jgi:hypothetical protein
MLDETSACKRTQFFGSGYSSSEEIRTNAAVLREHADLARVLDRSGGTSFLQIDNGINPDPFVCSSLPLLDSRHNVVGLVSEGHPWNHGLSGYYSGLLDVLAAVDARPRDFVVLLSYDERGRAQARLVQEATVLLGYAPGHVVSWADLERNNLDLAVWPEEGIYPTDPIESMAAPSGSGCLRGAGKVCPRGGHNNLRVARGSNKAELAAGVYRREFAQCYNQGVLFGSCAAIVNDTSKPVVVRAAWLKQLYGHEITLRGGDVQSGGVIDVTSAAFTPGKTKVPADGAILLAQ